MNYAYDYLNKLGYNVQTDYYDKIEQWTNIWKGKAEWLDVKTIDNGKYPMYSLNIAKRSCEDLASIITSEPFTIKAKKNNKELENNIEETKLIKKLPEAIETMGYSGSVAFITRIKDAVLVGDGDNLRLEKGKDTTKSLVMVDASHIIPLTIVDGEIVNVAFTSEDKIMVGNKNKKVIYLELHELKEKGYQITNKYLDAENGKEIVVEGVLETYNTLSKTPMFAIAKLPKVNVIDGNNGLGVSLFANAIDQLRILDLTYNNFGMDFKLGQKIMLVNKKLTKIENVPYKDTNGNIQQRQKIVYPSDIKKQLFTDISDGIMGSGKETPYIYEYNPDLRVGDNKEGVQFALDTYSFEIGFGTHYYSFDKGNLATATEAILSRQDFVVNGNNVRKTINDFIKRTCEALFVCDKLLGGNIKEDQNISIAEVDGFLQDDESQRDKLFSDLNAGLISKKRYLMKVYKMTEEEAIKELEEIEKENDITMDTTLEEE